MSGPHFDLGHVLGRLVRLGIALSPAVIKPRLTAGIDPTHRLFLEQPRRSPKRENISNIFVWK
jgi:hypothetical protein